MRLSHLLVLVYKAKSLFKDGSFNRLYRHTSNYGFGGVLGQVMGFLLIPLYTRYLTPSDYGIVELTSTLTAFAIPFMKFGLPGSVSRFYFDYKNNPEELRNYITTMNRLLNLLAIILGSIVIVLLYFFGEKMMKGLAFWPFMVISIVTAGLGANIQLQAKLMQNREQSRYTVILRTIFIFLSILLAIIFVVFLKMGALGLVLSSFIITIMFFFQASYYLRNDTNGRFNQQMAKEGLKYGSGVLPHHFAAAASPMINKTLLTNIGTIASLGHYSIAMRFFLPLELLYTSTNTAFAPIYTAYRKDKDSLKIRQNVRQLLIVSLIAYAAMQSVGPLLMDIVLPDSYKVAIPLISVLSIAFVAKVVYGICVAEIFYSKKTKFISIITFGGLLINTLICVLFVKGYASHAVSWAFVGGFVISAALSYVYKKKISDFEMYNKEIAWFLIASACVTFIAFGIYY